MHLVTSLAGLSVRLFTESPSTPSPTVSQTVQQTTTVASSTPSPSSQPVATTDRGVTSPTTQTDNSGKHLRVVLCVCTCVCTARAFG